MVSVAQLVRALDCGSRGWGFESPRSPHYNAISTQLPANEHRIIKAFINIIVL
jgi:hypothetical protein